jgi:hypothetical protein
MIEFLLSNLKSISTGLAVLFGIGLAVLFGIGLAVLFGIGLIKKNQELKQENKEINKTLHIQERIICVKKENESIIVDDAYERMRNREDKL